MSITGSLLVHGVIILSVDFNKMLMRLFSFLPSCLHSPYNTMREPRDTTANIACHHDMAISIIKKHQTVAPGRGQQVSSDMSDETTWEGSANHHLGDSSRIFFNGSLQAGENSSCSPTKPNSNFQHT